MGSLHGLELAESEMRSVTNGKWSPHLRGEGQSESVARAHRIVLTIAPILSHMKWLRHIDRFDASHLGCNAVIAAFPSHLALKEFLRIAPFAPMPRRHERCATPDGVRCTKGIRGLKSALPSQDAPDRRSTISLVQFTDASHRIEFVLVKGAERAHD